MLEERDITLDGRSSDKGDRARTEIHMTEWTTDVDDGGAIDEPPMTSQPVLRTVMRTGAREATSRLLTANQPARKTSEPQPSAKEV